jgi:hypothetical protein
MGKGAARTEGSLGENLTHYTAVRMRVVGNGDLNLKLYSYDDIESYDMVPLTLAATTNREPTRLCNFIQQRAYLEIKQTEKDDYFRINRIIVFAKEVFTSFPG